MDLELDKYVLFKDESLVIRYIKYDNVDSLKDYVMEHQHTLDDQIIDRMFNFTVTLIRPSCFKLLCHYFPDRIPDDVLKKSVHTILCQKQDLDDMPMKTEEQCDAMQSMADDMASNVIKVGEIVMFLKERNLLSNEDKISASELVEEYELGEIFDRIVAIF